MQPKWGEGAMSPILPNPGKPSGRALRHEFLSSFRHIFRLNQTEGREGGRVRNKEEFPLSAFKTTSKEIHHDVA